MILPATPDDVCPGSGEDADGVWMVMPAVPGVLVELLGPGVGSAAVAGEVAESVTELFVCAVSESD